MSLCEPSQFEPRRYGRLIAYPDRLDERLVTLAEFYQPYRTSFLLILPSQALLETAGLPQELSKPDPSF